MPTVIVSPRLVSVTEKHNVLINLTRETMLAVSRSSSSTTIKDVDVLTLKSPAAMVTVSLQRILVMVKPNAKMVLMKVIRNAASRTSKPTPARDAAATQKPNGLVPMVTVSPTKATVMVKPNVEINLTRVTSNAASESIANMESKPVAVTQILNTPVTMVSVFQRRAFVTVKLSAPMVLMKVTNNAASESSPSMMTLDVVARRTNSNVLTRDASAETTSVMVDPNALMTLMRVSNNAASRNTSTTITRNVAASQVLSSLVLTAIVSLLQVSVMVNLPVVIAQMKIMPLLIS